MREKQRRSTNSARTSNCASAANKETSATAIRESTGRRGAELEARAQGPLLVHHGARREKGASDASSADIMPVVSTC